MNNLIDKESFFEKYKISMEEYKITGLQWEVLDEIYKHFMNIIPRLESTAKTISDILRNHSDAHTVRSRIKDPEHLIEKIIRKTIVKKLKEKKEDYEINCSNYTEKITDLIGIRVLHLYKNQAQHIDKTIRENWETLEVPVIYFRKGDYKDSELNNTSEVEYKEHPAGYRSWHYLIKTKLTKLEYIAEIQVRTIFEEGWSEVDHQLRYPYDLNNILLNNQLLVLNRLAGNADEMVNSIRETKQTLEELNTETKNQNHIIADLKEEIEELYKNQEIAEKDKKSLQEKVLKLEASQLRSHVGTNSLESSILIPNLGYVIDNNQKYKLLDNNNNKGIQITNPTYPIDQKLQNSNPKLGYYLNEENNPTYLSYERPTVSGVSLIPNMDKKDHSQ